MNKFSWLIILPGENFFQHVWRQLHRTDCWSVCHSITTLCPSNATSWAQWGSSWSSRLTVIVATFVSDWCHWNLISHKPGLYKNKCSEYFLQYIGACLGQNFALVNIAVFLLLMKVHGKLAYLCYGKPLWLKTLWQVGLVTGGCGFSYPTKQDVISLSNRLVYMLLLLVLVSVQ